MDEEIWKDIKGYEGRYLISNFGKVKGYPRWVEQPHGGKRFIDGHVLAQRLSGSGYMTIRLIGANGVNKTFLTHRLVAITFIDNPFNLPCVNHKDENKTNNIVSNLEWCTYKDNINYGSCIKRRDEKRQYRVEMIDIKTNKVIKIFDSVKKASEETGVSESSISSVCSQTGKSYQAGGFVWRYADEKIRRKKGVSDELKIGNYHIRNRKIEMIDKNTGKVLQVFNSITDAKRKTGISDASIVTVCKNRRNTAGGYKWCYADN